MTDARTRLTQCFANVFPDLPAEQLPKATTASLPAWDSLAHVTLLSAIGEEFSLDIPPDDFVELTSYAAIADYLASRQPDPVARE